MTDLEELVSDLLRSVEQRDGERLMDILHPEVEFVWPKSLPGFGGTHRGEAVLRMHATWTALWDPLQPTQAERQLSPRIVASNDQEVVVLYRQRGVDSAGARCDAEVVGLYQVDDGRVRRLQMFFFDPGAVAKFLRGAHPSAAV